LDQSAKLLRDFALLFLRASISLTKLACERTLDPKIWQPHHPRTSWKRSKIGWPDFWDTSSKSGRSRDHLTVPSSTRYFGSPWPLATQRVRKN